MPAWVRISTKSGSEVGLYLYRFPRLTPILGNSFPPRAQRDNAANDGARRITVSQDGHGGPKGSGIVAHMTGSAPKTKRSCIGGDHLSAVPQLRCGCPRRKLKWHL